MKQIFYWLRGAILDKAFEGYNGQTLVDIHDVGNIINEAEAKWGYHAICYLDSPCEYQNEDIRVDEPDCCEWVRADYICGVRYVKAHDTWEKQIDGGWIPVEQKTPEDFTYVYATCISLVDNRKAWVVEGVYHSLTGWKELTPYISLGKAKVVAWMPKKTPAPYQKGE